MFTQCNKYYQKSLLKKYFLYYFIILQIFLASLKEAKTKTEITTFTSDFSSKKKKNNIKKHFKIIFHNKILSSLKFIETG